MSDTLQLCRTALQDNQHTLHQAAWLLFAPAFNPRAADRLLVGQKDAVIQLCLAVLDTDELYDEAAPGSSNAPIHCVDLLAHWQVQAAVPRLLCILEAGGEDAIAVVENRLVKQKHKCSRNLRETLQGYIQDMREQGHL